VDADYDLAFSRVVVPILHLFGPATLLVSAGFDAHEDDPLARMRLSVAGFRGMMRRLASVADACCGGRLALVTEGGYNLPAFASSLDGVIAELAGDDAVAASGEAAEADPETSALARAVVDRVRLVQSPFWRGL
jgi:acetoin utilization deacetylase AcuC-like enzyme